MIKANQNPLDFPKTLKELEDKLRVLEPKKACGVDSILNEMLKHTEQSFKLCMLKLFNNVLCVGFFHEIWNKGLISPIYKNGDKLDPNNYRGICVNSNLGKVLCSSILNTRLLHFLMKHNALSKRRAGTRMFGADTAIARLSHTCSPALASRLCGSGGGGVILIFLIFSVHSGKDGHNVSFPSMIRFSLTAAVRVVMDGRDR